MEWLLLVVLQKSSDGVRYDPIPYACEQHCIAAAKEFVKQYPAFEWRDHRYAGGMIQLVMRPHVECQPNRMPEELAEAEAGDEPVARRDQCPVPMMDFPAHDEAAGP